ncbi:hypothetical protein JHW43_009119 [Diplocarpon mali]|nr:hypothetical protein JHW43_009119 [Diplocarpon mali]
MAETRPRSQNLGRGDSGEGRSLGELPRNLGRRSNPVSDTIGAEQLDLLEGTDYTEQVVRHMILELTPETRDCLFDDYLGSPGPEAIEPGEPSMIEIPFDKVPAINVSCEFELTRITGPVARHEAGNIRRIAQPSSFLSLYAEEDLIEAFRRLFNTFTSFGYLILNAEEPDPLTPGEILFFGVSTCSGSYVTGRQKLVRKPEKNDPMAIVLIAKKWRGENVTEWIRRFKIFEQMRRLFVPRYEDEADKTKKSPKNKKHKKLQKGGGAKEGEWHGEGEETDDEERQVRQRDRSEIPRHVPIINLDPWQEDKDTIYSFG